MKASKKLFALLLAAMMTTTLAACNSDSSNNSSASTSPAGEESTATADASESSETVSAEPAEVTLPIADGETLTMFASLDPNATIVVTDYNDNTFFQELEKRTGVHIEWQLSSSADVTTNFNLMIASNQLPDLVSGAQNYSDGLDAGIDDGYYLDLTDKVDEYMPHYQAVRKANHDVEIDTMTDSGRIPGIYQIFTETQGPFLGMQVRQDWLDKCGLDTPVTFDDWEEMLTVFKDEMGAYAPLSLTFNGFDNVTGGMAAGFDVKADFQLDETGKVIYGPYSENWKAYVTKMHDWFEKGLIDPDFMTQDSMMVDTTAVITGKTGAWQSMYTMAALYESSSEDPDMNIVPVVAPVQSEEDQLHVRFRDLNLGTCVAISAKSDKWETAMKWMDYLFTDEGSLLASYGIEGDTYTLDESGNPVFTDKILNNPDYSFAQAISNFTLPNGILGCDYDWTRELSAVPEKDVASFDVWGSAGQDYTLPTLSLTKDESVERAGLVTDIQTYAKEKTTQMITGVLDIESEWDTYMSDIASMGIDRAIEITQAAYDRYLQR